MNWKWLRLVFLLPVLALVGCGSDTATGPNFTAASGNLSTAAATANKTAIAAGVVLNFTTPNGNPGARDEYLASCTTKSPVDPVADPDSDNVKTQTRTYACNNVAGDTRSITYTQNGTASVLDKDDADPKGGWKYSYNITGSHSGGDTWAWTGFWDFTKSTTSYTYESDYKGTFGNTRSGSGTAGGTWKHVVTPVDMVNPYSGGGAISMDGYYAYNFVESGVTTNYVFKMASEGLTYGAYPGCANFFNAGKYTFTDGSNNTVVIEFTDCNTKTFKYNGSTI